MKIIVMLIWAGSAHGGPTTITGFDTLQACIDQIPAIIQEYTAMNIAYHVDNQARCKELHK